MMTHESLSTPAAATPTTTGRVAMLTFTKVPSDRVKTYVAFLLSRGVPVTLICLYQHSWWEFRNVEHLDVVPLRRAEKRHPMNVVESVVVYDVAGAAIHGARRLTRKAPALRPPVIAIQRTHVRVAEAFHTKVYNRLYAVVRAQILASLGRRELHKKGPIPPLERIIAADTNAVALGWWLAKRFPQAVATMALERQPYADLPEIVDVPAPILREPTDGN
jgi:hypothetical protein